MSFKLHLIIISFIIVAVYAVWQMMDHAPAPAAAPPPPPKDSQYSIAISHASWSLNCRTMGGSDYASPEDPYARNRSGNSKDRPDNVLGKVSELCNGHLKCDIPVNIETFGNEPFPECNNRVLEVEYRCFSFDRPWTVKSSSGILSINCDKS